MSSLYPVFLCLWVHIVQRGDDMAYRVEYDSKVKWEEQPKGKPSCRFLVGCGCFALFLILVSLHWSAGKEILVQLLLPGDAQATWNGMVQLSDNLRNGIPLSFAFREFCDGILQSCY